MKVACFGVAGAEPAVSLWDSPTALQSWLHDPSAQFDPSTAVAWWVGPQHEPSDDEAVTRLAFLRAHGPSAYAFSPAQLREPLHIDRVFLDDVEVQMLVAQLNADLYQRYPEPNALIFSLHPADIVDGVGALLMAVRRDVPVGCGAFKMLDDQPGTAEVRRMYVVPSARGQKIGAAILAEVEARAAVIGARRLVLELGPRQPEAIHRFERAGYVVCAPWGEFVGKDLSICMEKLTT